MYKKPKCGHTQPTADEAINMMTETARLIETFTPASRLQKMINDKLADLGADESLMIKAQNGRTCIYNWPNYGRIPYHYVDVLAQIPEVIDAGFTRESLRPDVKAWNLRE